MNNKILGEIAIGTALLVALVVGLVIFEQNRRIQGLEQARESANTQLATKDASLEEPERKQSDVSTYQEIGPNNVSPAAPNQVPAMAPSSAAPSWAAASPAAASQVSKQPDQQVSQKVAIVFTVKDQKGKLLKGILCALKADEGKGRMIPEVSKKTGPNGQCSFQSLDPSFPYLVRVYWTSDRSRVSDVSLSWIPAGTTVTREIVKPIGM